MSPEVGYWYKGLCTLHSGMPNTIEGGIAALTAELALSKVKAISGVWNIKRINTILIYELEDGGEISERPVITWTCTGFVPSKPINLFTPPEEEKESVRKLYEDADWTSAVCEKLEVFPTVTMKE